MILVVSAAFASTTLTVSSGGNVTASSGRWFDYVIVILMENHSINFTYHNGGVTNSCIGNCTYFTSLANSNGLALSHSNEAVNQRSIGAYVSVTSGYVLPGDCNVVPGGPGHPCNCNDGPGTSSCPFFPQLNIVDRLEAAHLTWKAYMEGYPQPSGCINQFTGAPSYYGPNHNPFLYYADIANNTGRCSHIVNANNQTIAQNPTGCWPTNVQTDDLLLNDLNSVATASNYMFLTPNQIDDVHNCNDVSAGNAWMQLMIPKILNSNLFQTKRAALYITFDEPYCTNPLGQTPCPQIPASASVNVYTTWASNPSRTGGSITKTQYKSNVGYSDFSQLKTVEDNWRLQCLQPADCNAGNMGEFFP